MARLIWLRSARRDLREIQRYIARDSVTHAKAMIARIRSQAARLAEFPQSGRMVPEYRDPQVREIIVGSYRVIYRYSPEHDLVEILAAFHGSMPMPDIEVDG